MTTLSGRTPGEVARYDLFKLVVAAVLMINWLFFCGGGTCVSDAPSPTAAGPVAVAPAPAQPVPVAQTVPAPAAAAGLGVAGFEWNGAKLVLSGKVPDEATRKAIVDQAIAALGADAVTDRLVVDAAAGVPAWQTHLAALLDWGRAKGVHGLAIDGQTVVLTGEVGTEAERAERVAFARTLFGAGTTIDDRMTVAAAASPAPATAQAASAAAPAAAPEPPPTSAKLYFATGSHALPADAAAATAALVEYAVAHPASKVVVSGFHDRTGRRDANELLAKNRAFATRDLLVRAGVPAERIDLVKPQVVDGGADLREARRVEVAIAR